MYSQCTSEILVFITESILKGLLICFEENKMKKIIQILLLPILIFNFTKNVIKKLSQKKLETDQIYTEPLANTQRFFVLKVLPSFKFVPRTTRKP